LRLAAGDQEGAERYLLQAVRLSRDGAPQARVQLAKLYFQRGVMEESRRYINEAMKMMEPASVDLLWLGLRVERKMGNKAGREVMRHCCACVIPARLSMQLFSKEILNE
jgi:type IV pilus assembly protein PilF